MKTKVIKIGGSCLTSSVDVKKLIPILETGEEFILVISAFKNVTNLLEKWFDTKDRKFLEELHNLFRTMFGDLFLEKNFEKDFLTFSDVINIHKDNVTRSYAQALGERMTSLVIKNYLENSGIDIEMAHDDPLIFGDENVFNYEKSSSRILDFYNTKKSKHVLTQGFVSIGEDGMLTNLGREGSDLTAAVWADVLSSECVLYKDVGAIYTSDPNINIDAKKINKINFENYKEDFYQSKVIQNKVIDFCIEKKISLSIYSFNKNICGTRIINK